MKSPQEIKEECLREAYARTPSSDIGAMISMAMELYGKELCEQKDKEIQELKAQIDLVKTSHYQLLSGQLVEDVEKSQADLAAAKALLKKAMTLWDNLAEAGQLTVGPKFIVTHESLLTEIENLK